MKRIISTAVIFVLICFSGFFVCWVGGVEPFTEAAGWLAFFFLYCAMAISFLMFSSMEDKP